MVHGYTIPFESIVIMLFLCSLHRVSPVGFNVTLRGRFYVAADLNCVKCYWGKENPAIS